VLESTVEMAPSATGVTGIKSTNLKIGLLPKIIKTVNVREKITYPLVLLVKVTVRCPVRVLAVESSTNVPLTTAVT